jgi:hypothetical protein
MEPMTMMAIGAGLGAAGGISNYMGGKSEAKRKSRAMDRYNRDSAAIYDAMVKDAWNQGQERQRGTGQVISGLTPAMSTPGTEAPQTASFIDAAPSGRGEAYDHILQTAMQPRAAVDQSSLDATQAGLDRNELARILDALGYSSTIESQVNDPAHKRLRWQKEQELAEAKRRLESVLGSTGNKARNLQLLGSLLNTGGQAAMMAGSFGGGPTAGIPGAGAATYGGGGMPGPAMGGGPSSIYAYMRP